MANRPSISAEITREILIASGHRCAVCGVGCPLERAHIIPWHKSKNHKVEDLICLCASCHERADLEGWGEKTLREYKERPWVLRQYKSEEFIGSKGKVELILAIELSDFDERNQRLIQYAIAAFLGISPNSVRITSVEEINSVRVTVELPTDNLEELVTAYHKGIPELDEYLNSFALRELRRVEDNKKDAYERGSYLKDELDSRLPQLNEVTNKNLAPTEIMANPVKVLAEQFLRRSPVTLLMVGIAISLIDVTALYAAATKEGVLHISQGVGMLNNYGLLSTIVGNPVMLWLAKEYYQGTLSIRTSKAILNFEPISKSLALLTDMIKLRQRYKFVIYLLMTMGGFFWLLNVGTYIVGNPEIKWGQKVFDSLDHPLTFTVTRFHNFFTWVIVMPLVGYVVLCCSLQLKRAIAIASQEAALKYDLLSPDRRGGFGFLRKAHLTFSVITGLIYVQILLQSLTFQKPNVESIISYIFLTVMVIWINGGVFRDIYAQIKTLRFESLDRIKDKVYKNDQLSFEILKYCYERRINWYSLVSMILQAAAIILTGIGLITENLYRIVR